MDIETGITYFKNYLQKNTSFDNEAFEEAISFMHVQFVQKNNLFVESGKLGRKFGFILSGMMRAYFLDDGKEITSCICSDNSFASSTTSLITQTPSEINIQALEDTYILTMSFEDLNKLFTKYPFWANVGRLIAEKEFLYSDCRLRCYSNQEATEKYMQLLRDNPGIINRVPLQYIASLLGIRPETLSRIRKNTARRIS